MSSDNIQVDFVWIFHILDGLNLKAPKIPMLRICLKITKIQIKVEIIDQNGQNTMKNVFLSFEFLV